MGFDEKNGDESSSGRRNFLLEFAKFGLSSSFLSEYLVMQQVCFESNFINGIHTLWQYGLWSFQTEDTKLERLLLKNQHIQRKLLNFEFWINGELSKSAKI